VSRVELLSQYGVWLCLCGAAAAKGRSPRPPLAVPHRPVPFTHPYRVLTYFQKQKVKAYDRQVRGLREGRERNIVINHYNGSASLPRLALLVPSLPLRALPSLPLDPRTGPAHPLHLADCRRCCRGCPLSCAPRSFATCTCPRWPTCRCYGELRHSSHLTPHITPHTPPHTPHHTSHPTRHSTPRVAQQVHNRARGPGSGPRPGPHPQAPPSCLSAHGRYLV
jgi:hypothetical protein